MKKILFLSFMLIGLTSAPQQMLAQGILGKVAKGLEKVNKGIDKANTKAQVAIGKAQVQENGVVVMNPVSRVMVVEVGRLWDIVSARTSATWSWCYA